MTTLFKICNRIIEYTFYILFFFTPLLFFKDTSELFEFNKMWFVFFCTVVITTAWAIKMIAAKRFFFQRTPLDIPIALFFLSQFIATVFSLDTHISLWGYYSRFNGSLFSTLSYVLLYYAFVSNLLLKQEPLNSPQPLLSAKQKKKLTHTPSFSLNDIAAKPFIYRILVILLVSGVFVALWGLPSHFGYDPTCFIFLFDSNDTLSKNLSNFNVSCWTAAFQPQIRIFSTLGQPNWLAAYLAYLLPLSLSFLLIITNYSLKKDKLVSLLFFTISEKTLVVLGKICHVLIPILFFVCLLFTKSQSGFIAFCLSLLLFIVLYMVFEHKARVSINILLHTASSRALLGFVGVVIVLTFFIGFPIERLNFLSFEGIKTHFTVSKQPVTSPAKQVQPAGELGGTDSGKIRSIVWRGALEAWLHYPVFGTGVETFAFAYYKYRPVQHNLTSEWDYLYNKAHNEFLNFLTTSGIVGLATYLLMIGYFLFICIKSLIGKWQMENDKWKIMILGLLCGYITILVTNFFGFSVVITSLFLFLTPAFVFVFADLLSPKSLFSIPKNENALVIQHKPLSTFQWVGDSIATLVGLYVFFTLYAYWQADTIYAKSQSYYNAGAYAEAYTLIQEALQNRADEPVYLNQRAIIDAGLTLNALYQKDATTAATHIVDAVESSNRVVEEHPNNVTFWKARVRIFSLLGQLDPVYYKYALEAIEKAQQLAPTDAAISYSRGVLYGQTGDTEKAKKIMEETIKLKPDYKDAYYALALFYRKLAVNAKGTVVKPELQQKAVDTLHVILDHLAPNDPEATKLLNSWEEK